MKGYLYQRAGIYQLRRTIDGKRTTVSLGVTTRGAAELARDRILADAVTERTEMSRIVPANAWGIFRDSLCRRQCSESTLRGYEQQWGRFVDVLGDKDLSRVSRETVTGYLTALKGSVGANTWNKHVGALKYVWKTLQIETGTSLPDVFLGVQALPVPIVRHQPFTTEQIQRLYAAADGELKDIVAIAAHTGLRRIDCVNLEIGSYDAVKGLLRLIPVKTGRNASEALIGCSGLVSSTLQARLEMPGGRFFPETSAVYEGCAQTFGARFQRFMVKTLDLNGDRGLYGFHSFRHFFRSTLTEQGVSERVIDCMMCHWQGKVTARYVHPSPASLKSAVQGLPELRP